MIRLLNQHIGVGQWNWEPADGNQPRMVVTDDGTTGFQFTGILTVDGNKHVGVGSSMLDNPKNLEMRIKDAATDALKRAAIQYGDAFGLHLYDKEGAARPSAAPPARPAPRADSVSGQQSGTGPGVATSSGGNSFTNSFNRANGGGQMSHTRAASVAQDSGEEVKCEVCGKTIEGYESHPSSKYKGQEVSATQLVADSRFHHKKALCYEHYKAAFPARPRPAG